MNIVIIGAGPAGEAAAKTARRLNANATIFLIEKEQPGGLCLNRGCIPSKTLLEHVHKRASDGKPIDWAQLQSFKSSVVGGIRTQLKSSLKTLKIQLIKGTARFTSPTTVDVASQTGNQSISFDKAIIATGTDAFFPPPLDGYKNEFLDSDKILETTQTPASLIVVGGGAVGCEFACLMNAAGSLVTIVELKEGLLPGEDPAVSAALARSFETRGIHVKTGAKVARVEKQPSRWSLTLSNDETITAEQVLVCVGRAPKYDSLDLDKAGIKAEKAGLVLDSHLKTTNANVYAAGDAATTRLAHAAASQGEVAAANALGGTATYDDRFVPRCLYSWPEVASVGAWKYQLEEKNQPVKASRAFFKGSAKALAANDADGFVQIVSDADSGKIAGAQIIGPHATELIHIFSVALKKEMTVKELSEVMFAHPTLSEVIKDAVRK